MNGPQTTKDAQWRILLGEVGPLLDKTEALLVSAESLSNVMKESHELITADLQKFGKKVHDWEISSDNVLQHVTHLLEKVATSQNVSPVLQKNSQPFDGKKNLVLIVSSMFCCSIFTGILVVLGMVSFNAKSNDYEHARIGRAVVQALPLLEPATRKKVEDALQKAAAAK
ncbi:hypothetical protein [Janthinobacterium sp. HH102]|uniref:hypothetical protein n=1 Tax=Janthinobacterium sp. HH102 TaxID=1537274 RepID=UPI00111322BC|nr:hypothetical protein [Janthinobacterium sp. HH102]